MAALAGVMYGFAPLFGLGVYYQTVLEAVALAATAIAGAVAGIALEVNWISKRRSRRLRSMIVGLLVGSIVFVVYTIVQNAGVVELSVYGAILKAATLVILIVIGAMLGTKVCVRSGMLSIGGAVNASKDVRHARRITDVALRKTLDLIAHLTLGVVVAVAVSTPTDQPAYPVALDTLFTASATITGFAVFGSAFSALGPNRNLIMGIAYVFISIIVVQSAFMLSLLGYVGFPASLWIGMTAVLLMLLVLAMVAGRIKSSGTDGGPGYLRYF